MTKWLALGGAVLLVALYLIWRELHAPADAIAATPAPAEPAAAPVEQPAAAKQLAKAAEKVAQIQSQAGKIDPGSDKLYARLDDVSVARLMMNAVKCYTGGLNRVDRNATVTLGFNYHIKDGEVTYSDVKVKDSSISDQALVSCFMQQVGRTHWHDDALPDIVAQEDELTITPERGMRKYTKENIENDPQGFDVIPPGYKGPGAK